MSLDIRDYMAVHVPDVCLKGADCRAARLTGISVISIEAEAHEAVQLERAKMAYEWADAMLKARELTP